MTIAHNTPRYLVHRPMTASDESSSLSIDPDDAGDGYSYGNRLGDGKS